MTAGTTTGGGFFSLLSLLRAIKGGLLVPASDGLAGLGGACMNPLFHLFSWVTLPRTPHKSVGGVLIGWGRVKGKWPVFLCAASTWLCRGDSLDSEADRLDLLPQSLSLSRGGSLQSSATQPVSPVWHWRVRTSFSLHLEPGKRAWALRYRQACPGTTA